MPTPSRRILLGSVVTRHRANAADSPDRRPRAVNSYHLRGEPTARAIVEAVAADYRTTNHPSAPETVDLTPFVGHHVTVLVTTRNAFGAPAIATAEGRLTSSRRNAFGLVRRGRSGKEIQLDPLGVLDIEIGHRDTGVFAARVQTTRRRYPRRLEPVTRDHLLALPEQAPDPARIALVLFGTWPTPEGASPGALWLLHSYLRDDDIAEGVLLLRPEHGYSEHGSAYGRHLLSLNAGVVCDPPALTLDDALDLTSQPYEDALRTFTEHHPPGR
jgi:hypothetical protein